jgi:glucose/arabinose dehydrogenase
MSTAIVAQATTLIVSESNGNKITQVSTTGTSSTFASGLSFPWQIAFDKSGNLYEADMNSGKINKFAKSGSTYGAATVFASGITNIYGLAFDSTGSLFVSDRTYDATGHIYKFVNSGGILSSTKTTFASGLTYAMNLAFDSHDNLFASVGASQGSIYKYTPGGSQSVFATNLSNAWGLAFDAAGNLYEGNYGNGIIYKFTAAGVRTTFANLSTVSGLVFDSDGNLFASKRSYDGGSGLVAGIYKYASVGGVLNTTPTAVITGLDNPTSLIVQSTTSAVPEPGTILAALSILGPAGMMFRRRKA